MMFVSWSDQNNILIYRTFEDFKRFHVSEYFPEKYDSYAALKASRSVVVLHQLCSCYFKDANVKQRKSGKLNRCLEILKLLETYSQELLKTDAKISQGEDVIQFFKAQTQDLDPSFPENRYEIIFPQQQLSSITHPQASQSYRCIETFETKDTKNKTFKVAKKEIVEVLIKDMTGWWLVENADKQIAWFPASYLEEIDAFSPQGKTNLPLLSAGSLYFVVRAYESQKADELSLNNGVIVEVVRKSDNGWWLIRSPAGRALATRSSKSPRLTHKDRNDSGFVESSAADLSYSLTDPDLAACVPKVPVRPSAHEILQKCSTITKRAVQQSSSRPALQALLPLQSVH
uniref:NADPH oxidase organizer 1 n=1 Tax=Aquila chrysaetos chrysaetos TaxID=223781 RepID=A0A663F5P2_AQUCH